MHAFAAILFVEWAFYFLSIGALICIICHLGVVVKQLRRIALPESSVVRILYPTTFGSGDMYGPDIVYQHSDDEDDPPK